MRWFLKVQSSTNQVYADTKRCVDSNICSSLKVPVETFLCVSRYVLFLLDYLSQYLSKVKPLLDQNEVSASFFLFLFFFAPVHFAFSELLLYLSAGKAEIINFSLFIVHLFV